MDLRPVLTGCHICRSKHADQLNKRMQERMPDLAIIRWLRAEGLPVWSRNTLMKHRRNHLTTEFETQRQVALAVMEKQAQTIKVPTADFALAVRDLANARLEAGEIKPSLAEGLRSQEILDRRASRGHDTKAVLMIWQALGGVVEGDYKELAPS